ncbi:hypothetical protein CEE36_11370 [candidate division TA06 bacterium B3_TA06]|uniref:Uncharacterized protein n=1 Tax=candidate division TA06 bacterium B3_TA06 TaxID=2012487 RepID=A0A532UPL7_UNCT6|nr:MAG: hypothetical protein CEE36_11370 [candidate division TA06 bacterium B3_TA06]
MIAHKEAVALFNAMDVLARLIENSKDREEADEVFGAIEDETCTDIAAFIWDYFVEWDLVEWKEDKDRTG